MSQRIFTIGHSTRPFGAFLALLEKFGIELLVDVRTVPRSRHVPHFNYGALEGALGGKGIGYRHLKLLGGLRKPEKDSINTGWRNASFRGYADFMQRLEFHKGIVELLVLCAKKRGALMCAEAVPWRCHRSLIADALVALHGAGVVHIISESSLRPHRLTPFAVIEENRIVYPHADKAAAGRR